MLVLKYSLLPGFERTGVLAPIVPVTFMNGNFEFSTFALVDSGGEQALISTSVAEVLNIDWQKLPKETLLNNMSMLFRLRSFVANPKWICYFGVRPKNVGLTTSGNFVYHTFPKLIARIDDYDFRLRINIAEGVSPFKCILGRKDIFQQAKITFEGYKKEFRIELRKLN